MASTGHKNDQIMAENAKKSDEHLKETDEIDGRKHKSRRHRRGKKHRPGSGKTDDEGTSTVRHKNPTMSSDEKHENQNSLQAEQSSTADTKQNIDNEQLTESNITAIEEKSAQGTKGGHPNEPGDLHAGASNPDKHTNRDNKHTPSKSNVADTPNSSSKHKQRQHTSSPHMPSTPASHETTDRNHNTSKHHGRQFRGKTPRHVKNDWSTPTAPNHTSKQSSSHHRQDMPGDGKHNSPRRQYHHEGPRTPVTEEAGHHIEGGHSSKKKKHKKKKTFEEYWTKDKVSAALKRGEVHKGNLRISPKNYEMAWVSLRGFKRDIAIVGMLPRNRALDGDVVALEILQKENWKVMHEEMKYHEDLVEETGEKLTNLQLTSEEEGNSNGGKSGGGTLPGSPKSPSKKHSNIDVNDIPEQYLQRTAKVVYIVEKKHPRIACGYLRPMTDPNDPDGLFSPTDSRLPRFRIAHDDCPPGFFDRPQDFATTLMIARMIEWQREAPQVSFLAKGVFARSLGEAGEIEPETDSILLINDIESSPFPQEVLDCLPKDLPWKIPQEELESRRDFRDVCVFTIDPATARDLDDALHCSKNDDGTFEIGVHIADVSFFVKEGTALDEVASSRATSTYMVQKVIPMLPRLLCEELCSLNPNEDRLTCSVLWKMDGNGVIQDEWMGKGIIRSRVKLSYEHAQEMIDNPEKMWGEEEHPPLGSGATITDIVQRVRDLHQIAAKLRRKRFENGTLRLDKAKISFDLDGKTGLPIGWHPYIQRESNKLIEEYMLLANMAVAHRIYKAFPDRAMLRCHPKPDARQLEEIRALCSSLGINFAHESSKGIQETLNTLPPNSPEHLVLSHLSMKPMKAAKYFGAAAAEGDPEEFLHYALSVPLYTHFTSPIRRYPDVIVHRLLAACLGVVPAPEFTSEDLDVIAGRCNDKKHAAKKAGEASVELYLGAFVRECGPLTEDGIVVHIMHESVDVLVPDFGIIKRIYFKFCDEVKSFKFQEGHKTRPAEVMITWKGPHDKRKTGEEENNGRKGGSNKGGKSPSNEDSDHHHRRTHTLKIFTRVRVVLKTESDKTKNKGGLKFSAELLPNSVKE